MAVDLLSLLQQAKLNNPSNAKYDPYFVQTQELAVANNPNDWVAQCVLAVCYFEGYSGVKADSLKAISIFKQIYAVSADIKDDQVLAICKYYLGKAYEYGLGSEKNTNLAVLFYCEARVLLTNNTTHYQDNSRYFARNLVTNYLTYDYPRKPHRDYENSELLTALGSYLLIDISINHANAETPIACYEKAAAKGNGYALMKLGRYYSTGLSTANRIIFSIGSAVRYIRAINYYSRALLSKQLDHPTTILTIRALEHLIGENKIKLEENSACSQGAFTVLGICKLEGHGGIVDKDTGLRYLTHNAQNHDTKAQLYLAQAFLTGQYVERNFQEAAKWYLLAVKEDIYPGDRKEAIQQLKTFIQANPLTHENSSLHEAYAACFKTGYGVDRDAEVAELVLKKVQAMTKSTTLNQERGKFEAIDEDYEDEDYEDEDEDSDNEYHETEDGKKDEAIVKKPDEEYQDADNEVNKLSKLEAKAKQGDDEALYSLAEAHRVGKIAEVNLQKSAAYFLKSAETAQKKGKQENKAVNKLKELADIDNPSVENVAYIQAYAECFRFGYGVEKNLDEFFRYSEAAVSYQKDPDNYLATTFCHYLSRNTQVDYKKAGEFFIKYGRRFSSSTIGHAQRHLSTLFGEKPPSPGLEYLQLAAAELSRISKDGINLRSLSEDIKVFLKVAQKTIAGFEHITKLATENPKNCMYQLAYATCLLHGYGISADTNAAIKYCRDAAATPGLTVPVDDVLLGIADELAIYFILLSGIQKGTSKSFKDFSNSILRLKKPSSDGRIFNQIINTVLIDIAKQLTENLAADVVARLHAFITCYGPENCPVEVMIALGQHYARSAKDHKEDARTAVDCFIAAAKQSPAGFDALDEIVDLERDNYLFASAKAACILEGWRPPANPSQAMSIFYMIANNEHVNKDEIDIAEYYLAKAYEEGLYGYEKDINRALVHYANATKCAYHSEYGAISAGKKLQKLIPEIRKTYKPDEMADEMLNALSCLLFYGQKFNLGMNCENSFDYMYTLHRRGHVMGTYYLGLYYQKQVRFNISVEYYATSLESKTLPPAEAKKAFQILDAAIKSDNKINDSIKAIHAMCYLYGHGIDQDIKKGMQILATLTEEKGCAKAHYFYGMAIEEGISAEGIATISRAALEYYFSAQENNNKLIGSVGAVQRLRALASDNAILNNNSSIAFYYAECLAYGYGNLVKDPQAAKKYYMIAASKSDAHADDICLAHCQGLINLTSQEFIELFNKAMKHATSSSSSAMDAEFSNVNEFIARIQSFLQNNPSQHNKEIELVLNITFARGVAGVSASDFKKYQDLARSYFKKLMSAQPGIANFYYGYLEKPAYTESSGCHSTISNYLRALESNALPDENAREAWEYFNEAATSTYNSNRHYGLVAIAKCYYQGLYVEKDQKKFIASLAECARSINEDQEFRNHLIYPDVVFELVTMQTDMLDLYPGSPCDFAEVAEGLGGAILRGERIAWLVNNLIKLLQQLCEKYKNSADPAHQPLFDTLWQYHQVMVMESPGYISAMLVKKLVQVDAKDPVTGNTFLHLLVMRANSLNINQQDEFTSIVRVIEQVLASADASLSAVENKQGINSANLAASPVLRALLMTYAEAAGPQAPKFYQFSLYRALLAGNFEEAERLLERGVHPDYITNTGNTLFHVLAVDPSMDIQIRGQYFIFIDKWLKKSADNVAVLKNILFDKGASGLSALDLAVSNEQHDFISLLARRLLDEQAGADEIAYQLGQIYESCATPDLERAVYYYLQAAKGASGSTEAAKLAISALIKLAEAENTSPAVLYSLGQIFENGYGIDPQLSMATKTYHHLIKLSFVSPQAVKFDDTELFATLKTDALIKLIQKGAFAKAGNLLDIMTTFNVVQSEKSENVLHKLVVKANRELDEFNKGNAAELVIDTLPSVMCLRKLLSHKKAKDLIYQQNEQGQTPIELAQHAEIISCFAELHNTDATDTAHYGRALYFALSEKYTEVAKKLVAAGAPVACTDRDGNNIFHKIANEANYAQEINAYVLIFSELALINKAIKFDNAFTAQFILEKNNDGNTPLDLAIANDNQACIDAFCQVLGWSKLQRYVYLNQPELIPNELAHQKMIDNAKDKGKGKAEVKKDYLNLNYLRLARSLERWDCLFALLPAGPLTDEEKYSLGEVLHWAIYADKPTIVERLLELDVNTNWQPDSDNPTKDSSLQMAVSLPSIQSMKVLLRYIAAGKVDPGQLSHAGATLLEAAFKTCNQEVFDALKPYVASKVIKISQTNNEGLTARAVADALYYQAAPQKIDPEGLDNDRSKWTLKQKQQVQEMLDDWSAATATWMQYQKFLPAVIDYLTFTENTEKTQLKRGAVNLWARGIAAFSSLLYSREGQAIVVENEENLKL